jgi:hypothetical protein
LLSARHRDVAQDRTDARAGFSHVTMDGAAKNINQLAKLISCQIELLYRLFSVPKLRLGLLQDAPKSHRPDLTREAGGVVSLDRKATQCCRAS